MAAAKAEIKKTDFSLDMEVEAIRVATIALEKFYAEIDIANYIEKEFDVKYGGTWKCLVGRVFDSNVTPLMKNYMYFSVGQVA